MVTLHCHIKQLISPSGAEAYIRLSWVTQSRLDAIEDTVPSFLVNDPDKLYNLPCSVPCDRALLPILFFVFNWIWPLWLSLCCHCLATKTDTEIWPCSCRSRHGSGQCQSSLITQASPVSHLVQLGNISILVSLLSLSLSLLRHTQQIQPPF